MTSAARFLLDNRSINATVRDDGPSRKRHVTPPACVRRDATEKEQLLMKYLRLRNKNFRYLIAILKESLPENYGSSESD